MQYLAAALLGYLLGSIPSGLLVGRYLRGIDIRKYGSKNLGATNMFRVLGPKPALAVLLADMGKGALAALSALYFASDETASVIGGVMAIIGHSYPLFSDFKGGKGVATGLGVILALMPELTLMVFAVWAAIVFFTRYVSLASVGAAALVPAFAWYLEYPWRLFVFSLLAALFVIARHKENMKRLLRGQETKITPGSLEKFKSAKGKR
ncbi:MAG: glycerol-3-phosphate 1-O-acyltransferase PlsY [Acidaminococcales bacterium]|jgi:glycerol-3-phosphate acyltransferase PlsY|nr:glycerol-3-phosphate 1-O-acyltransferase PlsY [Acidaminococcales bacterium]